MSRLQKGRQETQNTGITMENKPDLIIGIDAGTSVIKAVAFDARGRQIDVAAVRNGYHLGRDGAATQNMNQTWRDCVRALQMLGDKVTSLATRTLAVAVTGQGDGTWLVGADNRAVDDAWLWLDARAVPTVNRLVSGEAERARFETTGTGLSTCQQGSQLAHMMAHYPELVSGAETALHCKDWLFLNMTGVRATDPSEAAFTFGDFRNRQYSDDVVAALGLQQQRRLLPDILDGTQTTMPLSPAAAEAMGLRQGTPVSLGFVDMVMTALSAGIFTGEPNVACSTIGSTGVHARAVRSKDVYLNAEGSGYVICLPAPDLVAQVQTHMAATLNIDWALGMVGDLMAQFGTKVEHADLVARIDDWMAATRPGELLYHPYISEAGERGPFIDPYARASLIGLGGTHGFAEIIRAIIEGLGMAARDCYTAMGDLPNELRITGGAARSGALRRVLADTLNLPVRVSARVEAGAAGAAMMAAVAIGAYDDMEACVDEWTRPYLGAAENPNPENVAIYDRVYPSYLRARRALPPIWRALAAHHVAEGNE